MTSDKSLVERLLALKNYGMVVPLNTAIDEAIATIKQLEREKGEAEAWSVQHADDMEKQLRRAEAAEARLATLLAPSGDKTTAEEMEICREIVEGGFYPCPIKSETLGRLLDDLDAKTARERVAVEEENEACARIVEEFVQRYPHLEWSQNIGWTADDRMPNRVDYLIKKIAESIRARRKGESNG